jgi:hypothetical protein
MKAFRLYTTLIGLVSGTGLFPFSPAWAQLQSSPAVHALPSEAELDALLDARKWNDLGAALSNLDGAASFSKSMDWLRTRLDAGGGLMLGMIYARDLWTAGKGQQVGDPANDMRVTAGMITLYTYELIVIDGAKCEDRTAPGHRLEQLLSTRQETLAYLKQLTPEWKTKVVNIAIAFEKKTAPLRRQDDLICRDGLEQYRVGLEKGTQREVPNAPNHSGKTVDVRPPADWVPNFSPPAVYQPLQEKARADMPSTLRQLIEQT